MRITHLNLYQHHSPSPSPRYLFLFIFTITHHQNQRAPPSNRYVKSMAAANLFQNNISLQSLRETFQSDGFVVFHDAIHPTVVSSLQSRLDEVLRGEYNRNIPPDKVPKQTIQNNASPLHRNDGSSSTSNVLQIINIHKCDHEFRQLATSEDIGRMVAELAGWKYGARLAQDQVWAK